MYRCAHWCGTTPPSPPLRTGPAASVCRAPRRGRCRRSACPSAAWGGRGAGGGGQGGGGGRLAFQDYGLDPWTLRRAEPLQHQGGRFWCTAAPSAVRRAYALPARCRLLACGRPYRAATLPALGLLASQPLQDASWGHGLFHLSLRTCSKLLPAHALRTPAPHHATHFSTELLPPFPPPLPPLPAHPSSGVMPMLVSTHCPHRTAATLLPLPGGRHEKREGSRVKRDQTEGRGEGTWDKGEAGASHKHPP